MLTLVIYTLIAIGVSFFCSLLEAVLLSLTPAYIAALRVSQPHLAQRLSLLRDNLDAPLVAILSINTIAHTIGAAGAGAQASIVFGNHAVGVFSALLTLAILFLSEIIPKTLGTSYWRQLAPSVALTLQLLVIVAKPLIVIAGWVTARLHRRDDRQHLRAEMAAMADIGAESGELDEQESAILKQLLHARSLPIGTIMTPRTVIHALPIQLTLQAFAQEHGNKSFSLIPVYEQEADNIVGYVNKAEVLLAEKHSPQRTLASLRHKLLVVPERVKLMVLFKLLLTRHQHIAIVVDEYGNVRGLITMEDIIESMLGLEIIDENDPSKDMQQLARKLWKHRQKERQIVVRDDNGTA